MIKLNVQFHVFSFFDNITGGPHLWIMQILFTQIYLLLTLHKSERGAPNS